MGFKHSFCQIGSLSLHFLLEVSDQSPRPLEGGKAPSTWGRIHVCRRGSVAETLSDVVGRGPLIAGVRFACEPQRAWFEYGLSELMACFLGFCAEHVIPLHLPDSLGIRTLCTRNQRLRETGQLAEPAWPLPAWPARTVLGDPKQPGVQEPVLVTPAEAPVPECHRYRMVAPARLILILSVFCPYR